MIILTFQVAFEIAESGAEYHLTLLLSPFGFTTYMKNSSDRDDNMTKEFLEYPVEEVSTVKKQIRMVLKNNTEDNKNESGEDSEDDSIDKQIVSGMNNNTIDDEGESEEPSIEIHEQSRQSKLINNQITRLSTHANFLEYPVDTISAYNEKV